MKVSFVIPTLNSGETLGECLAAIRAQDVPEDWYEIVVADAGSSDDTLEIARKYGVDAICENPLKTGEAGKTAGIKAASGDVIALVDSDNVLPSPDWLRRMLAPLREDAEIVASEPIEYVARQTDPAPTRYFALLGMNDPICLFTGNYDRTCAVTGKWTGLDVETADMGDYLKLNLREGALPTIGANGFVFRRSLLDGTNWDPYLFDIDILQQKLPVSVAKVKTGIVHLYCPRFSDFVRKQRRRIRDFLFFAQEKKRAYPWNRQRKTGLVLFALSCVLVVPLLAQAALGFARRPDRAWAYHLPACLATLWTYGWAAVGKALGRRQAPADRSSWQKN